MEGIGGGGDKPTHTHARTHTLSLSTSLNLSLCCCTDCAAVGAQRSKRKETEMQREHNSHHPAKPARRKHTLTHSSSLCFTHAQVCDAASNSIRAKVRLDAANHAATHDGQLFKAKRKGNCFIACTSLPHTHTHTHTHTHSHAHAHTLARMHANTHARTHTHTHAHTLTRMHANTHAHTHTVSLFAFVALRTITHSCARVVCSSSCRPLPRDHHPQRRPNQHRIRHCRHLCRGCGNKSRHHPRA